VIGKASDRSLVPTGSAQLHIPPRPPQPCSVNQAKAASERGICTQEPDAQCK
jgi:hypothetical protein